MDNRQKTKRLLKRLRLWPPFLGAGIHVTRVADDFLTIEVELRMKFFNRNYVGTHFGGSLYSMCDPWFMVMLIEHLGPDYIVWDKAATIRFKKPGKGTVKATFHIPWSAWQRFARKLTRKAKSSHNFRPKSQTQMAMLWPKWISCCTFGARTKPEQDYFFFFTARPSTSYRASNSSFPDPKKARAGKLSWKYVL